MLLLNRCQWILCYCFRNINNRALYWDYKNKDCWRIYYFIVNSLLVNIVLVRPALWKNCKALQWRSFSFLSLSYLYSSLSHSLSSVTSYNQMCLTVLVAAWSAQGASLVYDQNVPLTHERIKRKAGKGDRSPPRFTALFCM